MLDMLATYDLELKLPKASFTKTGYKFIGWNKDKSFNALYTDEAIVKNLTKNLEVTLYAVWENIGLVNYKEEIYVERPDSPVDKTNYTESDFVLDKTNTYSALPETSVINKTVSLDGFLMNDELSVKTGIVKADGSLVLKLYFVRIRRNVEYHYNGEVERVTLKYGDVINKYFDDLDPKIQKENFRVAGWTHNNLDYEFGSLMGLQNIVLKIKYERSKWQVRFNFKVETASGEFIEERLTDNKFYARSDSVSYVYNVAGFENETFSYVVPTAYQSEEEIIEVNTEVKIKRLTVNVLYELEGAPSLTAGSLPQVKKYRFGETATLPEGLESTGYNFLGFFKDDLEIHNSYTITEGDTLKGTITIKVRFTDLEQVPYTIKFYKEKTSVDPEIDSSIYAKDTHFEEEENIERTAAINSTVTLDINQNEFKNKYEGFTPKTLSISKHEGVALKGAGKLILEVYYVRNRHKAVFDLQGGTSAITKLEYTYKYNDLIVNPFVGSLPEKENYEFKHFINTKDNLEFNFGTIRMENENINLKAVYQRNKWKISYSYKEELVSGLYSLPVTKTTLEFYSKSETFTDTITKNGFTQVNVSIEIPSSFVGDNTDTYTHTTVYELNRKTASFKFVDSHPLVPFEAGALPPNKTYKFGETYNLPEVSKLGYNFVGYKSSKTGSYVAPGDHTVELSDLDTIVTYTLEFNQMPNDRQITLDYGYYVGTNWVSVDTKVYTGYNGEVRTVSLLEYEEFNIIGGSTTVTLTFDSLTKTQKITLEKNASMWVTVKFKAGENASVTETVYEVIKNRKLNGKNQPNVLPPSINPNTGYKIDPNGAWDPEFTENMVVTGSVTFKSKVVPDETLTYRYTVNYLREGDNFVLHTAKTGSHHVGVLDVGPHPVINGYTTNTPTTITITSNEALNKLDVIYRKDPTLWRDVTIKHMGEDTSGNYNVLLNQETINEAVNNIITITPKSFTGFTFDTGNPSTYQVTNENTQEVIVRYKRNKHTISFDPNGGDKVPNQMTGVYYDQVVTLSVNPVPKLTGHTLVGWTIDDTMEEFISGVTKMPNKSITLKAKWRVNTFTVKFNGNNHTSGLMNDQVVTYGVPTTLNLNEYERVNYIFRGWSKTSTGGGELLIDGADITNYQESGLLELYAVWDEKEYPVTLNLNGGTLVGQNGGQVIYRLKAKNFPYVLPTPTKTQGGNNLEFLGWYDENNAGGTKYTVLSSTGEYTLYAIWGDVVNYIAEYPQTKVTDEALINKLNTLTPVESSKTLQTSQGKTHTEKWNTVVYQENKFEKVGSDYFKYEPIVFREFPNGSYYSKYILDYQVYDEHGDAEEITNVYDNSYVKRYLEQVFKEKSGLSSIGLMSFEELKNPINFANDEARKAESTDYAKAVANGERGKITEWSVIYEYLLNNYWTNTANPHSNVYVFSISETGASVYGDNIFNYGLRIVGN